VADAVTLNRDVFAKDPLEATIPNNGVATVADLRPTDDVETLRYELRTFVCKGEYARGLQTILDTYLRNVGNPEQPAVWVSGFYGSGKSHLVKVLRYLWTDYHFPDGTSARDLATLPTEIRDALKELSISGRQAGGLQAMAGTLGAGAGNIRLTLLSLLFRSVGLPEEYFAAQCVLWLKSIHAYDTVKSAVEAAGRDLHAELRRMYMSPVLARAILAAQPALAPDEAGIHALLRTQFPNVADISISDTLDTIAEVLSLNDKMPCTLLVLDEVQQAIHRRQRRAQLRRPGGHRGLQQEVRRSRALRRDRPIGALRHAAVAAPEGSLHRDRRVVRHRRGGGDAPDRAAQVAGAPLRARSGPGRQQW